MRFGARFKIFVAIFFAIMMVGFINPQSSYAACGDSNTNSRRVRFWGLPTWDEYLQTDPAQGNAVCNFGFPEDIFLVLLAVAEMIVRAAAYVALGVVIFGGFKFMVSRGDPQKIADAKNTIQDAVIGLVIATLSTVIISYVAGILA
jgi:hypothetical protein